MHEIALDSNGKRLLVTSGLVRAPIYQVSTIIRSSQLFFFKKQALMHSSAISLQVQGHESGLRTLPHSSSITSVDWQPTLPMYITGSADHSVRVTSILWSIKQGYLLDILSMSQCNLRYYCLKRPVKLVVTTCFLARKHPFLSTVLTLWEAFRCHGIFCMEELCLSCTRGVHYG